MEPLDPQEEWSMVEVQAPRKAPMEVVSFQTMSFEIRVVEDLAEDEISQELRSWAEEDWSFGIGCLCPAVIDGEPVAVGAVLVESGNSVVDSESSGCLTCFASCY